MLQLEGFFEACGYQDDPWLQTFLQEAYNRVLLSQISEDAIKRVTRAEGNANNCIMCFERSSVPAVQHDVGESWQPGRGITFGISQSLGILFQGEVPPSQPLPCVRPV